MEENTNKEREVFVPFCDIKLNRAAGSFSVKAVGQDKPRGRLSTSATNNSKSLAISPSDSWLKAQAILADAGDCRSCNSLVYELLQLTSFKLHGYTFRDGISAMLVCALHNIRTMHKSHIISSEDVETLLSYIDTHLYRFRDFGIDWEELL